MSEPPRRFDSYRARAEGLVESPSRLQKLTRQAAAKLTSAGGGRFREMRNQLSLGIELIKAWVAGDYKDVSKTTIVVMVAALLYFVVPFDVVPDFIFGWGFMDDAAVLGYVFAQLQTEIEAFKAWREGRSQNEDGSEDKNEDEGTMA